MADTQVEFSGSLVLSAWVETSHPTPLRVRITEVKAREIDARLLVAVNVDQACDAVRGWLEALVVESGV